MRAVSPGGFTRTTMRRQAPFFRIENALKKKWGEERYNAALKAEIQVLKDRLAKLERKLGVDPFAERVAITSIRTVGDLCAAYGKCLSEDDGPQATEPEAARRAPGSAAALDAQRELRKKARE